MKAIHSKKPVCAMLVAVDETKAALLLYVLVTGELHETGKK